MYETVLVPTDGSDYAMAAAETGIELARAHDATLHVISVADTGLLGGVRLPGDVSSASEAFTERAREFIDDVAAMATDLDVRTEVISGVPGAEILEYAAEVDADVIVMGTRGRGGVHRMAVGSVTDHVIRFGDVQVLVAK